MAVKFHILLLNGPNINMLGTREPEKYGPLTLAEIVNRLTSEAAALNVSLDHLQSNAEHALIDRIHQAKDNVDYILINPAAFTHTSVAIRDALLAVNIPFIEIHLSNVLSSDWRLKPASMKLDSLVIAHQPWRGEYVPGPCTHRPSSHESRGRLKSVTVRSGLGRNW